MNSTAGTPIQDPKGNCGFPGFDGMLATNTLGYVEQMQENGVPVTYGYISDAHDFHVPNTTTDAFSSSAQGPGEFNYQQQLKSYDDAFNAFFTNLAAHGIDKSNTLFVITVDEGDHFAGGVGLPDPDHPGALTYAHTNCVANAQGILNCPSNQIGEVNANLQPLTGRTDFAVHSDDAPTFYLTGNPAPGSDQVRSLEHTLAGMKLSDPYVNNGSARPDRGQLRRPGRGEDAAHGEHGSEPDAVVHDVRQRRHLLHGKPNRPVVREQPVRRSGLRLEPRRCPGGDRQHLGGHRRAGCRRERRRLVDVDGSHEPPPDDHGADRPAGRLHAGRNRPLAGADVGRHAGDAGRAADDSRSGSASSTSS